MTPPQADGVSAICRFGFSRTGTAEAEPTIKLRSKLLRNETQQKLKFFAFPCSDKLAHKGNCQFTLRHQ